MGGYVVNFAVYTMAMTGLIFFALMVYKKCTFGGSIKTTKAKLLNIEETITIAPRKTLYVVNAGEERFLIAGDIDKTTLIAKLENNHNAKEIKDVTEEISKAEHQEAIKNKEVKQEIEKLYTKNTNSIDDLPVIVDFQKKVQQKNVLHNMLKKINE